MKKLLFFIAFTSVFSAFSQTDYSFVYDSDAILAKGIELYEKGEYAQAQAEFEKISPFDPKYLTAQYEKSLALSAQEKKDELKALYEDLYSKGRFPEMPSLYTVYGSYLSDEKDYANAENIFGEGQKYLAHSSNFLYNVAILHLRKEERQKCIDVVKQLITENPNYASAHYLLGIIALEDGKITEGSLALMTYLMVVPNGKFANDAIVKLNAKFGQNYLDKSKFQYSKSGDNFEEIDMILRNQLPLKPVYKVKSDFDDIIIRQMQAVVEYSAEHKIGDGFFETTYMPWIKALAQKNQFEGLSYYILISMEEKLGKKLSSKKKKITEFFDNFVQKDFWELMARRKMDHYGKMEDITIIFKDGDPFLIGNLANGKKEGKFKLLNDNGNTVGDLYFENDLGVGKQKYYDEKGVVNLEKNYKDNMLDGAKTSYYTNGIISTTETYKADELEGLSTSYYVNGAKQCEVNFVKGERDGNLICLYQNGTKKSETVYTNGKLNGPFTYYNESGDITETGAYLDGQLNGKYTEYYDGKQVKAEAMYDKGKIQGTFKRYYANKGLEQENTYVNGKITKAATYFADGKTNTESFFDDKGEMTAYSYFDHEGNKYFEEKYKGGELKSGLQYQANSPKPTEATISKKPFQIKNFDGSQRVAGDFDKGLKTNEWKYYYNNGVMRLKEGYKFGKQEGVAFAYNRNGSISNITNYVNDTINGIYEGYDNGVRDRVYSYVKGDQNGPFKTFYPDGKPSAEGYLIDGEVNFVKFNYWQDGTVSRKDTYIDDVLTYSELFKPNGEKDGSVDFKNKTGKFNENRNGGNTTNSYSFTNGAYNGKYSQKDKLNTPIIEAEFVNDTRHNAYKSYSPSGMLYNESNYYNGKKHGPEKSYDLAGNLRILQEYSFGDEFGKVTRYYHNKSKMIEFNMFDGSIEGEYTYFNQKGEAILVLGYSDNTIRYYVKRNKAGELAEKVPVTLETADISSAYANGKTAIQFNLVKGNIEGAITIFNQEGKSEFQSEYVKGLLNGERTEYYANGSVYKKEHFKNGNYDGKQEFFQQDGKPIISAEMKNDEYHGTTLIYANGKLSLTKKYNSDELVDIR
jgi:antitoxin component YwqK of YwqJK toxin-antitoxin module/Tfp pilus assembly protein PilF